LGSGLAVPDSELPATNSTSVEAEARAAIEIYTVELNVTWSEDTFRSTSTVASTAGARGQARGDASKAKDDIPPGPTGHGSTRVPDQRPLLLRRARNELLPRSVAESRLGADGRR